MPITVWKANGLHLRDTLQLIECIKASKQVAQRSCEISSVLPMLSLQKGMLKLGHKKP